MQAAAERRKLAQAKVPVMYYFCLLQLSKGVAEGAMRQSEGRLFHVLASFFSAASPQSASASLIYPIPQDIEPPLFRFCRLDYLDANCLRLLSYPPIIVTRRWLTNGEIPAFVLDSIA
ncbi:hypothetical protein LY78DRAFT_71269 [Colletotrichum sublineola]|nr:hypothetical protein LY78DRAFT_71269 [Colletotrichum sublineola]